MRWKPARTWRNVSSRLPSLRRGLASTSRHARHALLNILNLPKDASRKEVRYCYLLEALKTHPDNNSGDPTRFLALQSAWEGYRLHARRHNSEPNDGFTTFGVGCSFSDSTEERRARQELIDQASRGMMNRRALSSAAPDSERE